MDIKVGDKVRYIGSSTVYNDMTHGKVYEVDGVFDDWLEVLDDVGDYCAFYASDFEPATDNPQAVPDYNNREWHGWNGGECPVHPKTRVQVLEPGGITWSAYAEDCSWASFRGGFRVTKPYVEPKKPREWWLCRDDQKDFVVTRLKPAARWDEIIHVREVLPE